ncbi:Amino acid permease [Quillaja saponaria]|uniref:Amino acid permease n=1 Tax=Quillaja saponaria TaxID=32244 RepID=A0AAD7KUC8_QUISA|nr:Amino acid permease [Quillaja saponaria]
MVGHGFNFDDDNRVKWTGTWITASAHIVTAVIGSGVLSLGWAVAQFGWIAGPIALLIFSSITCFTWPSKGLIASIRMAMMLVVIHQIITFKIIFGVIQIILSQIPNFQELSWLSVLAAIMSFGYSLIALGLSIAKVAAGDPVRTSLTGVTIGVDVTSSQKMWNSFQAIGDIAFSYAFSLVLIEIQDTLKSSPPENQMMKMSCGILGYAAFGNAAPENFLTGFGFYEPFWLVDVANLFVVIHLVGAYQVSSGKTIINVVMAWP